MPKEENYYNFIKNRVMDVHKVKEVLDNESAYELYNNDLNFLLTNNFFLVHYPELYNINDLIQLKDIATDIDKNKFSTKEEYNNFKRAANATKTRLRRYEKNNHVKIKKI